MLDLTTAVMIILLFVLILGTYYYTQNDKSELSLDDASTSKILAALKQLSFRIDVLEKRHSLDKEQTERSRKNIYDTLGMQIEARKLDNIAVTGLLDRHAGLSGDANPRAH